MDHFASGGDFYLGSGMEQSKPVGGYMVGYGLWLADRHFVGITGYYH
jgi:hypothetical protein